MKTSLELFHLNAGKYPIPDDEGELTFSGNTLYYQGYFGDNVVQSVSKNMSEYPTDPLTGKRYIYSVTQNKSELEILALLEGDGLALNAIGQTNAANIKVTPRINGNYNGLFAKTTAHIVPIPSIITSEEFTVGGKTELTEGILDSMVTNLGLNIPNNGNVVSGTGKLAALALTGTLIPAKDADDTVKAAVMEVIKAAYVNETQLNGAGIYEYVLNAGTDPSVLADMFETVVLGDSSKIVTSSVVSAPASFPTTCGNLESITYQQAQDNKATIISNIADYIGCEINDYTGTGVYIAGLTNSSTDIMVVSKSDISGSKKWKTANTTTANTTSAIDGLANTVAMVTAGISLHPAGESCRIIGTNWYLPSKDELNTIYINKSSLGTFADNYYWSSTENDAGYAWEQYFLNGNQYYSLNKYNLGDVRCASRF